MSNIEIIEYDSKYQKEVKHFVLTTLKEFGFDYKPEWDYDLNDPNKYYEAFKEFDTKGTGTIMEEIVGRALTNSYHKRLAYLEGKKIITLAEYGKRHKLSHSNLINKAGRQTIEAFLEKGVWKIGVGG